MMNETATVAPASADDCNDAGAITLTAISKWFDTADGGPLTVLQDINLAVPAHSIFAILGASTDAGPATALARQLLLQDRLRKLAKKNAGVKKEKLLPLT